MKRHDSRSDCAKATGVVAINIQNVDDFFLGALLDIRRSYSNDLKRFAIVTCHK